MKYSDNDSNSQIGANSFFQGKFSIKGNLRIDGRFEGTTLETDQIHVGVSGKVKSNIIADSITIEGVVIGNIIAKIRIILFPTAKVVGNIETAELIVQNGVEFEGRCKISKNTSISLEKIIKEKYFDESYKMPDAS